MGLQVTAGSIMERLHNIISNVPEVNLAQTLSNQPPRLKLGLPELDRILGGGIPRGMITELYGPAGSGRTSIALTATAAAQAAGEFVAWVDAFDAFSPRAAQEAGVDPKTLLWVRHASMCQVLRATSLVLDTAGFSLAILDLLPPAHESGFKKKAAILQRPSTWLRLKRAAERSRAALLLLAPYSLAGSFSSLALALAPLNTSWSGPMKGPAIMCRSNITISVSRNRTGREGGESHISMDTAY
ncbi:MAG: hypothetical protein GXP49_09475 [Deltaproteobacteria bacterium]|nr:hypothetical protein [Deltaproteobacteria bacterium]